LALFIFRDSDNQYLFCIYFKELTSGYFAVNNVKMNIPFVLDVLRKIGDEFLKDFKKVPVPNDGPGFFSLFNENEERCLSFIKEQLTAAYPDIPFSDGEFNFNEQEKPLPLPEYWICDAMDGAVQYLQHLPGWTINLVLVRAGAPYFAAIYDPLMGEMYWAKKGVGAYLNDIPMKVNIKPESRLMMAVFDHPTGAEKISGRISDSIKGLLDQFAVVRNFGPHGLQLASVGCGRIDVFCQEGLDTYNWLPGILIASEAGAVISATDGREWHWGESSLFVAAPGIIERFIKFAAYDQIQNGGRN
jgi:myo-inositol-1(or 4)-monophosphatase